MRLNKYIANAGIASRRTADDYIASGRVTVNGSVITQLGTQVSMDDRITVDDALITIPTETMIIALYKPRGVTTTLKDAHAEKTITDILPPDLPRLNPAGRLDTESEGLLLLTNDGELLQEVTHPSFAHEKEYEVETINPISDAYLQQLSEGVLLDEGLTNPARVTRLGKNAFSIVLTQGWKRQIRRMVKRCNNRVTALKRVRIGKLRLGALQPGEFCIVQKEDIL